MSYNFSATGCPNEREVFTEEYRANMAAHRERLEQDKRIRSIRERATRGGNVALANRCWDALAGHEEPRAALLSAEDSADNHTGSNT